MSKINNDGFNTIVEREPIRKSFAAGGGVEAMVIQGGVYPPLIGKYQQEMNAYQTLANQSYLEKGGKIPDNILSILRRGTIDGNKYTLPAQMDRADYTKANKVIEGMGGKWNRSAKAHVFDNDTSAKLFWEQINASNEYKNLKQEFQFFPTPGQLAEKMVAIASLQEGDYVLEPSAGKGHILDAIIKEINHIRTGQYFSIFVTAIELMPQNFEYLKDKYEFPVLNLDFLTFNPKRTFFNKIIMNPPFSGGQDIEHVMHAYELLRLNGTLVAIMSESAFSNTYKRNKDFSAFLKKSAATIEKLPAHTFMDSDNKTPVPTRMVVIKKSDDIISKLMRDREEKIIPLENTPESLRERKLTESPSVIKMFTAQKTSPFRNFPLLKHKQLQKLQEIKDSYQLVTGSLPMMNFSGLSSPELVANIKILQAIMESNYPPGFRTTLNDSEEKFLEKVTEEFLRTGVQFKNKTQVEKLAAHYNIYSKNEIKELTELAIVSMARFIATMGGTIEKKFNHIVSLYQAQVNLSHRTSTSVLLQQYSTPAPIGFLAGEYCKGKSEVPYSALYFEPSAGNGLLTIAVPAANWVVNEIDEIRNLHLQGQGFKAVLRLDASKPFTLFPKMFDGVITNPPFGAMEGVQYNAINIKSLDHLMALYALETMKDHGRAAIIIGGHTEYDSEGRIQAGKNRIFLSYLYKHFAVDDVINIDGALYSRMGTSFDVRLILISARKEIPAGFPPLKNPALTETDNQSAAVVKSFQQLYERIVKLI